MNTPSLNKRIFTLIIIFTLIWGYLPGITCESCKHLQQFSLTNNQSCPFPVSTDENHHLQLDFHFSGITFDLYDESIVVRVNETDMYRTSPGYPVLPVNLTVLEFPFGTRILNITYHHSSPIVFNLTHSLALGAFPGSDSLFRFPLRKHSNAVLDLHDTSYPTDWISYHTGGGLSYGHHKTFLVLRVYPVMYFPLPHQLQFIRQITINVTYEEPKEPFFQNPSIYDLLIIAPSHFITPLQPFAAHKNLYGIRTKLVSLDEVYEEIFWHGRDNAEKIKYFIKNAIENWGIKYVLLIGGLHGQTFTWNLPVRYSHVVPPEEQEYPEPSFISDLYYADIYDAEGNFSSWDSNNDDAFAVWNETYKEEMDNYPDVYLGRLPCRNNLEVKTMVNKIITYEQNTFNNEWFKNLVLVAGDSYPDACGYNEGELICDKTIKLMPGFTPVKVYASDQDINRKTVNSALNPGCGFAYFCGHGSAATWSTHFPPNGTVWTTGYTIKDMMTLKNKGKYPVTVVGGCHNGQFNVSMMNIIKGVLNDGLHYFSTEPGNFGKFWYNEWVPNCWAWWLTSKQNGGAIATIANTGLGTHGEDDSDHNDIADYLEVLDGWLELRFFQLYGEEHNTFLGDNHGQTITEYLHRFLGNNDKMDVKMVQQWELFGDPSLKIGGYPSP